MFDYIYSDIIDLTAKEILSIPFLDFETLVSSSTGEINPINREREKRGLPPKYEKKADFKGLTIVVTNEHSVNLHGSLHKYFHGNNSGVFSSAEVKQTVHYIASTLKIDPGLTRLHNLEFGVNIILPFNVSTFLDSILCYRGQRPDRNTYSGKGALIKFYFEHYEVKLYDKGKQYGLNDNILRVEIKVRRMQFLHKKGLLIKTLNDLLNTNYYSNLKSILMKTVDSMILCDRDSNKKRMSKNEVRIFSECSNQYYWLDLWENNQNYYRKRKTYFRKLNDLFGQKKIQSTVVELVSKQWDQLTQITGTDITGVNEISRSEITPQKFQQIQTTCTDITLQVLGNIQPPILEVRKCKSCGRDISDQKPGSLFCSEKKYGAEGKKCRNRHSNSRNNFYKRENKKKLRGLLFDTIPLLNKSELKQFSKTNRRNEN